MTLVEILVVLAVILIMIGALGGAGIRLKQQSEIRLTEGVIRVLEMALEQYYTDYSAYVPQVDNQTQFNNSVGQTSTRIRPPASPLGRRSGKAGLVRRSAVLLSPSQSQCRPDYQYSDGSGNQ